MHVSYFLLKKLAIELDKEFTQSILSQCFSQQKDELILQFEKGSKSLFIKVLVAPDFASISFPKIFNRSRKNNIDLFTDLPGQKLLTVQSYENERCVSLHFENDLTLLFKMHGNRSNIILFRQDICVSLFRNNFPGDEAIKLNQLNRKIDWSFEFYEKNVTTIKQNYFVFDKETWKVIEEKQNGISDTKEKWQIIKKTKEALETPTYFVQPSSAQQKPIFSLLPIASENVKIFGTATEALTYFTSELHQYKHFFSLQQENIRFIQQKIKSALEYNRKAKEKLAELQNDQHYQQWADIIMANLHSIPAGMESVNLFDFYNNKEIEIKLKREISAQKNAEIFYTKAKNKHIEIQKIRQAIEEKEKQIETLQQQLEEVKAAQVPKALTKLNIQTSSGKEEKTLPFHEHNFKSFRIWVGKNAHANDELTLSYTFKEDLWLHAKDVSGSHVVIKYQSGKVFPKDVIERAAQLAAYYSKSKNESFTLSQQILILKEQQKIFVLVNLASITI
ncbi:MAG: NFACT RNA binding domain-containing protein [Cyclobacteriaceae bacterium]|nr:NFACT RNA binding domain-containing protein [Cyclobacteriaceae bacterium]